VEEGEEEELPASAGMELDPEPKENNVFDGDGLGDIVTTVNGRLHVSTPTLRAVGGIVDDLMALVDMVLPPGRPSRANRQPRSTGRRDRAFGTSHSAGGEGSPHDCGAAAGQDGGASCPAALPGAHDSPED